MKQLIALGVAISAIAVVGCASASQQTARPSAVSTVSPSQAPPASTPPVANPVSTVGDCAATLQTWGSEGATQQFNAVNDDAQQLSSDISEASGYDSTILADADQLESDARAAQADPPPSCSGVTSEYYKAMTNLALAGHDISVENGDTGGRLFHDGVIQLDNAMNGVNAALG